MKKDLTSKHFTQPSPASSIRARSFLAFQREEGSIGVPTRLCYCPCLTFSFSFPWSGRLWRLRHLSKAPAAAALTCRLKLECQEAREYETAGGNVRISKFSQGYLDQYWTSIGKTRDFEIIIKISIGMWNNGRVKPRVGRVGKEKDGRHSQPCRWRGTRRPHTYLFWIYIPRSSALQEEKDSSQEDLSECMSLVFERFFFFFVER